ncbi:hypothetical protein R3P38DRAFT_2956128, partial [Favolaschia claudopus]
MASLSFTRKSAPRIYIFLCLALAFLVHTRFNNIHTALAHTYAHSIYTGITFAHWHRTNNNTNTNTNTRLFLLVSCVHPFFTGLPRPFLHPLWLIPRTMRYVSLIHSLHACSPFYFRSFTLCVSFTYVLALTHTYHTYMQRYFPFF